MTAPSLVERVGRAICKSRTCEGVNCCQWPAQRGRIKCPVRDGGYDDASLAAISAVLEAMEEQHKGAIINGRYIETPAGRLWRAMLAAFRQEHGL